jgi:uncharacterized metal-binding protein YceD (DUF177 family)
MRQALSQVADPAPELSRPLPVREVEAGPVVIEIAANDAERAALAGRFGLLELGALTARAEACRADARDGSGPVVRLTIDWRAEVVQACVVSLEPVPAALGESGVEVEFALGDRREPSRKELGFTLDDVDPPEPLSGEVIDVGEVVAEQLGLAIDPYPRKAGAALDWHAAPEGDAPARRSPFAALARLRPAPDEGRNG